MLSPNYLDEKSIVYNKAEVMKSFQEMISDALEMHWDYTNDDPDVKEIARHNIKIKNKVDKDIPEVI